MALLAVHDNTPSITSSATFSADENQKSIGTVTATDADGDSLTYSIQGTQGTSSLHMEEFRNSSIVYIVPCTRYIVHRLASTSIHGIQCHVCVCTVYIRS